ncbi:MAG TPA: hypothetical protein VNQ77_09025 [Frankiaceae bacterium]|nr:hypothetical protein [Frankiaceae bacterium]
MRRTVLALAACLVAAPLTAPASAVDYEVESYCRFVLKSVPTKEEVLVAVVAEAHALGPVPAAATTVTCTVRNDRHQEYRVTGNSVGPDAYAAGAEYMSWVGVEVCSTSSATWIEPDLRQTTVSEGIKCRPGNA